MWNPQPSSCFTLKWLFRLCGFWSHLSVSQDSSVLSAPNLWRPMKWKSTSSCVSASLVCPTTVSVGTAPGPSTWARFHTHSHPASVPGLRTRWWHEACRIPSMRHWTNDLCVDRYLLEEALKRQVLQCPGLKVRVRTCLPAVNVVKTSLVVGTLKITWLAL